MKYKRTVYHSLALITQFGINMLVPIFLCTFAGIFLDRLCHTTFIAIILFFLGAAAGFRNVYIFAKKVYERPTERDDVIAPAKGKEVKDER